MTKFYPSSHQRVVSGCGLITRKKCVLGVWEKLIMKLHEFINVLLESVYHDDHDT